jgi:hypothetical protein
MGGKCDVHNNFAQVVLCRCDTRSRSQSIQTARIIRSPCKCRSIVEATGGKLVWSCRPSPFPGNPGIQFEILNSNHSKGRELYVADFLLPKVGKKEFGSKGPYEHYGYKIRAYRKFKILTQKTGFRL